MAIIEQIFKALGGSAVIASETGIPVQTVHDWKTNGNIPHWRRAAVIDAAKRLNKSLDPELSAYLASSEKAKAAQPAPPAEQSSNEPTQAAA